MKFCLLILLFYSGVCNAQEWQAEFLGGASGYNGDLTQRRISLHQIGPALNFNVKYNSESFINFRAGIVYTKVGANDKNNPAQDLKSRNLNFKTDIFEVNLIAEVNFVEPEYYTAYPYVFAGIGVFHFNPYSYDENNKKTYLPPLSTEGEGLKEYPGRKKYSLTQLCIPIGFGWKMSINRKWDLSYEFGYRILFTDYLDDVSKTYVNLNTLANEKGSESAAFSYRGTKPFLYEGQVRGNSSINDSYFFAGIKISTKIGDIKKKSY